MTHYSCTCNHQHYAVNKYISKRMKGLKQPMFFTKLASKSPLILLCKFKPIPSKNLQKMSI